MSPLAPAQPSTFAGVHTVEVASAQLINDSLRRITFTAPSLRGHELTGPDEFFGLVMPPIGEDFHALANAQNLRAAVADHPHLALRWYTVRAHRPADGEIDVDIVDHGDNGPGTAWMRRAQPGQQAGLWPATALWAPTARDAILVADPSALPAARAIIASLDSQERARTTVIAVVDKPSEVETGLEELAGELAHFALTTTDNLAADLAATTAACGYLWACGEGDMVKSVRAWGINSRHLTSDNITFSPFWFTGRARP